MNGLLSRGPRRQRASALLQLPALRPFTGQRCIKRFEHLRRADDAGEVFSGLGYAE